MSQQKRFETHGSKGSGMKKTLEMEPETTTTMLSARNNELVRYHFGKRTSIVYFSSQQNGFQCMVLAKAS